MYGVGIHLEYYLRLDHVGFQELVVCLDHYRIRNFCHDNI